MISWHNWWPWTKPGYITMTWRQSNNQWSGSIVVHPAQKNSKCKNRLEKFLPQFFGQESISSLIIFQRAKLSTQCIIHLCWCNRRKFGMKAPWEGHQGRLVLPGQCPSSPGTCNPEETGLPGLPISRSSTLFFGSGPIRLPPVPWTEKTIERSPFFVWRRGRCCHGEVVGWTTFWIFFKWLAKVRATG